MTTFVLTMLTCEIGQVIICVHKAETQQFEAVDLMLSSSVGKSYTISLLLIISK